MFFWVIKNMDTMEYAANADRGVGEFTIRITDAEMYLSLESVLAEIAFDRDYRSRWSNREPYNLKAVKIMCQEIE